VKFPDARRRRPALVVVIALLAAVAAHTADAQPETNLLFCAPVDTLTLPPGKITGLTWIGADTLAVLTDIPDSLTELGHRQVALVFQDRYGAVLRQEDFTGTLARGLAYDGEFLWSCGDDDEGGSILYQIDADTCSVKEAFPTPGHAPVGLAWDSRYVWISDRDSGRLDRFDPETGAITRSVVTPGFSPYGVSWDGRYTWICDSGTGRLYRLVGSRRNWNATVDVESFLFRGSDVLLAHDGAALWMHARGDSVAVRLQFY